MKIEVNLQKKHFILVLSTILLLGGIAYALGQNPKIFGHKSSEIDWSEQLTQIKVTNLNVSKLCIGNDCRTSWPSAGGATLPTCANQQVLKYDTSTNSWVCANDLDTDTRCDVYKKCSQLCIGTDCRTSWPSSAQCLYKGKAYSPGYRCRTSDACFGNTNSYSVPYQECTKDGVWQTGTLTNQKICPVYDLCSSL